MVFKIQILGWVRRLTNYCGPVMIVVSLTLLAGCGQKGPLFLQAPPPLLPEVITPIPVLPTASQTPTVPAASAPAKP